MATEHEARRNWMVALDVAGLMACLLAMLGLGYLKAQHPDSITEGVFAALLTQLANFGGYFGLSLRDAHSFEFGSSRGSKEKDEVIANAAQK